MAGSLKRILVLSAIVAAVVYLRYGTVSPCGIVRVQIREAARREGGPSGALASVVPDKVIDSYLWANHQEPTPGSCIAIALNIANAPSQGKDVQPISAPLRSTISIPRPQIQTTPEYLKVLAVAKTMVAVKECRGKRLSGELTGYEEAAICVKQRLMPEFRQMHYSHMDLLQQFLDARTDVARKLDQGWLTEAQASQEVAKLTRAMATEEQVLDASQ